MSEQQTDLPASLFIYEPNKIAPVIFAVAFAVSGAIHAWQCHRYNSWKWTILLPLCCFIFAAGFALREYGAFNYTFTKANLNVYIASTCLIYMSPPLLELANYHILGRILYYVPYHSPLHPGRVLTTFGALSAVVEVLNAIGVSYTANAWLPEKFVNLGHILAKASLIIQIIVIVLFAVLATTFRHRCVKGGLTNANVLNPITTLYVSMGLILGRTIYRVIEYFSMTAVGQSTDLEAMSPIVRYEWYFWVFEAVLMLLNCFLWNVRHPAGRLPQDKNIYLARDGVTEVLGEGWEDRRPFLVTMLDPFGWCTSHKQQGRKEAWMSHRGTSQDVAERQHLGHDFA